MPSGLVALLDDMAVIARAASSSMDDVAVAAGKAGTKTAGVVIDDAAVTPRYVTGLSPARELPIIAKIARGSLKNKLVFLLPAALILSEFLPGAIIWLLMLGGAFLCYEGAEKVLEKLGAAKHGATLEDHITDPVAFENQRVSGAIRTDMILSTEIMAIALNEVAAETLVMRAAVLAIVGIAVTAAVYGAVAVIVKLDDIGLHLTQKSGAAARALGAFLLRSVPHLLTMLTIVGTIAMLWVGGGIIVHGTHEVGFHAIYDAIHGAEQAVASASGAAGGVLGWLTYAALSAVLGVVLGAAIAIVLHKLLGVGSGHGH
ncbi:MAG: ABC transporter [Erythrobacter sp. SCN 62-14]|mgnify:CR=1 FL=1|nr:MAG: ABC transporter [Erythrobacter sp. SCN 62-14]